MSDSTRTEREQGKLAGRPGTSRLQEGGHAEYVRAQRVADRALREQHREHVGDVQVRATISQRLPCLSGLRATRAVLVMRLTAKSVRLGQGVTSVVALLLSSPSTLRPDVDIHDGDLFNRSER